MNEVKKRFVKMTCKSCNQVTVMEHDTVQMEYNDALKDVSQKSEGTPHHVIKTALNRLKSTMGYGIPDKET